MLSGEILSQAPLSVALLPPPSLIKVCKAMATIATLANQQNIDDDDIYLENGLMSYENPNYHMDPQRIERNSHLYEEILSELQQQNSLKGTSCRKDYSRMDLGSLGIDMKDNFGSAEKKSLMDSSPSEAKRKSDQVSEKDEGRVMKEQTNNAEANNTIRHISGNMNSNDLYALPNKRKGSFSNAVKVEEDVTEDDEEELEKGRKEEVEGIEDKDANKDLPPGWEKHEDTDGPYYWHIKSGTIQREPPVWPKDPPRELKTPILSTNPQQFLTFAKSPNNNYSFSSAMTSFYNNKDGLGNRIQESQSLSVTRSNTSSALDQEEERKRKEDLAFKRRSYPLKSESDRPIRFAVRSLGWVEIAEEDLTPERSSKAVNKCIVDLSLGRNDLLDVVGRWGDGKDLFMDLDEGALKLIDPENLTILNTQPIHTIRVWGVGRDNGRDFAYVARDRLTRIHMCHVFRCDTAARTIANTLRDICKRIMIERSLQLDASGTNSNGARSAIRPTDLPTENRRWVRHTQSFPTPMEEPKKVLKAQYLGSQEVNQATGMDILNSAIESVLQQTNPESWEKVNVSVAPSMISIYSAGDDSRLLVECRVRYLSFLGIGKNVKNCAFIMHTAQDKFIVHVFQCEPSSGALCKTIEAACKLRYQKCLDAHPENRLLADTQTPSKGLGATIKNLMNTFSLKKDKASS
ncbi:protein Fe65 homolog isoform X1 [Phlebotomus papatasi]|uniref:protein Fe65 homolog isoform X1 n=1 Tax=Phlebotomus papatasi TaxID=29031 RepID=UPI00248335B4|nr:protein Fe65 homolog isoform X1 [Phlebotomus papatasi]XP_055707041.1 protein Fe65 homolog isoform X1 [Phlebotomus papatasi]